MNATKPLLIGLALTALVASAIAQTAPERPERPARPERVEVFRGAHRGPGGPAQHRLGEHFGGGPEQHVAAKRFWDKPEAVELLGLTEPQIALLDTAFEEHKAALEEIRGNAREARERLADAMQADNPDITQVYAAIDEVTGTQNEQMKVTLGHRVAVKNILTPEQLELLQEHRIDRVREEMRVRIRTEGPDGEITEEVLEYNTGDSPEDREEIRQRMMELRERGTEDRRSAWRERQGAEAGDRPVRRERPDGERRRRD